MAPSLRMQLSWHNPKTQRQQTSEGKIDARISISFQKPGEETPEAADRDGIVDSEDGIRAVRGRNPIDPDSVRRYLEEKFGDDLKAVRSAMQKLAKAYKLQQLAHDAYRLYERFRPAIPAGKKGWGAKGDLDLGLIGRLAKEG